MALPLLRLARSILERLRPYRWRFTIAVLQVFVMSALELLQPWPLKIVVDHVFTGLPVPWPGLSHLESQTLLFVGCLMLVLVYALLGVFTITSNYVLLGGVRAASRPPQCPVQASVARRRLSRKHLTLRTRLKPLTRKTICFSKSTQMHDIVIGLFVNRYAFGLSV